MRTAPRATERTRPDSAIFDRLRRAPRSRPGDEHAPPRHAPPLILDSRAPHRRRAGSRPPSFGTPVRAVVSAPRRARLGETDLEVSTLVFGSMGRRRRDEASRARVLDAAIEAGLTSIDTAPLYDFGEVEAFLGRALAGRRNRVELLSKVGLRWDGAHGEVLFSLEQAGRQRTVRRDSRPASIRRDVEESLARLRTDHLDLCQIHHPDRRIPLEDALGELVRLRDEGKIRHLGISNVEDRELATCLAFFRDAAPGRGIASLQLHYSLLERGAEADRIPTAHASALGVLAYTPLEGGALSDRFVRDAGWRRERSESDPLFRAPNVGPLRAAVADALIPVARDLGVPASTVALAWLLARPQRVMPIVGASSEGHVREHAAAWDTPLENTAAESLAEAFAALKIDRNPNATFTTRLRNKIRRLLERGSRLRRGSAR